MHDALIVGAGPAGSATAHFLSRRGLDVLLVDRAAFPRDKTCGDGLTPRALRVLERMGVLQEVASHGCPVGTYEVVAPNGAATAAPITAEHGALVVARRTLDEIVLRRAIASGAGFESHTLVSHVEPAPDRAIVHTQGGRTIHARVAVLATGAATAALNRSGVLRRRPRVMLAARAYFENLQTAVGRSFQMRLDGAPLPGYGWVFPVSSTAANVGVAFLAQGRGGATKTARTAFETFVSTPGVATLLAGGQQAGPVRSYPIRIDFLSAQTSAKRLLLVGEAAGLVNPLTGEGIDYALESGQIAAEHLWGTFNLGDPSRDHLVAYDRRLRDHFERLFRFSAWVRDWTSRPPLLNVLVSQANRRPELRQLLANIMLGEREPSAGGPLTMLARLLVYLARNPQRTYS